jgi:hypothetical protein
MTTLFLAVLAICVVLYFAAPKQRDRQRVRVFVHGREYFIGGSCYYSNATLEWTTGNFTKRLELGPPMIFEYKENKDVPW